MPNEINDYVLANQNNFQFVFNRFFKEPNSTEEFDHYGVRLRAHFIYYERILNIV